MHTLQYFVEYWRVCFFYAVFRREIIRYEEQITTVYSTNLANHIYTVKKRTEVIFIPYNLYIFLKRPKIFWHNRCIPPGLADIIVFCENREGIPMSSQIFDYDIEQFLCGFLSISMVISRARGPPLEYSLDSNHRILKEEAMNRKNLYNTLPEDQDIQNRFTAYVQAAMKNTRSTYYREKLTREERETVYDEVND